MAAGNFSLRFATLSLAAGLLLQCASCCVYKYGEDPEHPFTKPDSLQYTYEFAGLDWEGTCATGTHQSPINIPQVLDYPHVPVTARTIPDFGFLRSNGTNVKIFNNLHVVQLEWSAESLQSNVSVAIPDMKTSVLTDALRSEATTQRVSVTPLQLHFHAHSEHGIGGAFYPLELHIVSHAPQAALPGCTGQFGCLTVVGVMFALDDDDKDNQMLTEIFNMMPGTANESAYLPQGETFDLNALLPANKSYVTYSGSLTTPPCSEEVLWHVMLHPLTFSSRQLQQFLNATGDIECTHSDDGLASNNQTTPKTTVKPAAASKEDATGASNMTIGVCKKLGAGQNYRMVQPVLDRTILMYIDESPTPAASSSSSSSSSDSVTNSSATSTKAVTTSAATTVGFSGLSAAFALVISAVAMLLV